MKNSLLSLLPAKRHFLPLCWVCMVVCPLFLGAAAGAQTLQAHFSADNTMGCGQLSVQFTDESSGNPSKWHWDFGNGMSSSQQNPGTTFTTPGTYTVTLTVSNGIASSSYQAFITVYDPPKPSFTLDPASGCYPLKVQFTDHSVAGTGTITNWTWDFGDGSPFSTQQNPAHVYDSAGTFHVKLSVTNSAGCTSSASNQKVVTNQGVTVDFSADNTFSCSSPLGVTFTASTSSTQDITYTWDFGDGTQDNGKVVSHTYTQKGDYTVMLTASVGSGGCQDQVIKNSYIHVGSYTADFEVPQGCAGTRLTFKNTSTPLPSSATWDFGDGTTAPGIHATHRFSTAGTYEVTLMNDYGGCRDTVKKSIATYPSPVADFKSDLQNYCGKPAAATFQNLSQGAVSWKWRFGDGDSSAAEAPVHTYRSAGSFGVSLTATSDKGCTDSIARAAYIHVDAPDIAFNASPGFGCLPLATTFHIPAASAGEITSYAWDFGDGSPISTEAAPPHTYTQAGDFKVTLDVVTRSGCKFSFARDNYIHTGAKPDVDFDAAPKITCLNKAVQFTNLSQPPGIAWTWIFPNDGGKTDTAENALHQFSTLGKQDVTLIVNNNGCETSLTKPGFVTTQPPKARFKSSLASCADPYTYQFNSDASQGATNWHWDFGDGKTADGIKNPSHTYGSTGAKRVILTVTNGTCSSGDTNWVQVTDEHPVLNSSSPTLCHGDKITLSAGNISIPQFVSSLVFNSGDGQTLTTRPAAGSLTPAQFVYKKNGTYQPVLIVKYLNGCADTVGATITVRGPDAAFTASSLEICQGNRVTFTDKSNPDPADAAIRQWIWDYGDGAKDTLASGSVVHTYQADGRYNTRLTVTDENGCTDKTSGAASLRIVVNPSKAAFSTPDTLACPGSAIRWNNMSTGNGIHYLWDFGNGTTATDAVPSGISYAKDSVYTVSLKITTDQGCADSVTKTDYIRIGTPHAVIADPADIKICRILKDTAVSLSENYRSIRWDFGDGAASGRDTAYHIYNVPGTYTQKLTINGYSPGCTASAEKKITIAGPIGTAVLDHTSGCFPLTVHFSARDVKRAVSYQWYFGNGASSDPSSDDQASYTYPREGLFHPTLKLTDDTGCYVIVPINDSITVIADSVGLRPEYSWPEVCDSNKVLFNANGSIFSVDELGQPADYHWDFGDPSTLDDVSPKQQPAYRYHGPGTYDATLKVKTKYGCVQTVPFQVTIPDSIPLQVTANSDLSEVCAGNPVQLHAASNIGEKYVWSPAQGTNDPASADVTVTPDSSTTYRVIAFSQNNCQSDTAEVPVIVHSIPEVDAGPDQTAATGSAVQLQATGSSDIVQWKWSPAQYLNCTYCIAPTSMPEQNMTYTVTATNGFGCSDSATVKISLVCDEGKVFIPNSFTPNNDGKNDIFYPRGRGVRTVVYFRIYNRFGQVVYEHTNFQLNDRSAGWDGTFKGQRLNPGVFVYSAQMICDNNKVFKLSGNITLLR